jgi:hypothetical protein
MSVWGHTHERKWLDAVSGAENENKITLRSTLLSKFINLFIVHFIPIKFGKLYFIDHLHDYNFVQIFEFF